MQTKNLKDKMLIDLISLTGHGIVDILACRAIQFAQYAQPVWYEPDNLLVDPILYLMLQRIAIINCMLECPSHLVFVSHPGGRDIGVS